jgi:hypothetical protein
MGHEAGVLVDLAQSQKVQTMAATAMDSLS